MTNKVCLITGAARGIGLAIAERFAEDGAIVYANDLFGGGGYASSQKITPIVFDVTDASAAKEALMAIYKKEGRIDCLVNNAAIISNKKLGMMLRNEMEQMYRVNVIAVIEMIQTVSRLMIRNGGGSIVNIASITGEKGSAGQVVYSSTKGAVIALTKSVAKELAANKIRVNAVAPGIVRTERFDELYEADGNKIDDRINHILLGRLGNSEDIANACSFLASDRSSYITGQILGVDGGAIM